MNRGYRLSTHANRQQNSIPLAKNSLSFILASEMIFFYFELRIINFNCFLNLLIYPITINELQL